MKLTFLGPLYARPGPYACAYLDTSRDVEEPDSAIDRRRRHVHEELAAQGADVASTGTVARVLGADEDIPGRHGQAVFAARGHLALVEELPHPPERETATFTTVPDAMPLARQHAPDIPYVAVAVHRAHDPEDVPVDVWEIGVQSGRWPVARLAPGPVDRRTVPYDQWPRAAAEVAAGLAAAADGGEAETIVLCGPPRMTTALAGRLPRRLSGRVTRVAKDADRAEEWPEPPGRAILEADLARVFDGRLAALDQQRLERFRSCRARGEGCVDGLADTLDALRRGEVEALFVTDPPEPRPPLYVGVTPRQVGLSAEEVFAQGVDSCWQESAPDAALIRVAVGTGADLVVVARNRLALADGVGALLR
ncbi:hypothetical protein [Yinghuangia seranimata]|uniref:baeRF2 domain-containing protein n=1 Tax=Yinghuangia seranimata TaxID=408067 RepID=UPI00248BDD0E|nr:hypothetical protein [Yinghuangia seranimata]MDI2124655.1 hypothetical protein [Yinghuangia seranimata]